MGVQKLVASLVSSLAWPSLVALALILFRNPITKKIGELDSIRGKGFRAIFAKTVTSSEEVIDQTIAAQLSGKIHIETSVQAELTVPEVPEKAPLAEGQAELESAAVENLIPLDEDAIWRPYQQLANVDPKYAVLEAGKRLDQSVIRLASPFGQPASPLFATRLLAQAGVIPADLGPAITNLMTLRNQVDGSLDFQLSKAEAENFIRTVKKSCELLDALPIASAIAHAKFTVGFGGVPSPVASAGVQAKFTAGMGTLPDAPISVKKEERVDG